MSRISLPTMTRSLKTCITHLHMTSSEVVITETDRLDNRDGKPNLRETGVDRGTTPDTMSTKVTMTCNNTINRITIQLKTLWRMISRRYGTTVKATTTPTPVNWHQNVCIKLPAFSLSRLERIRHRFTAILLVNTASHLLHHH